MAKIIVVEDDIELAEMIVRWLEKEHHIVEMVCEGGEGLSRLRHYAYDLAVLDWNLPGMEGIDILRQVRLLSIPVPVLMLTGKADVLDRIEGLNSGADDYLSKPFHARELLARVGALLRRPQSYVGAADQLKCGRLQLEPGTVVVRRDGEAIRLQPKEFALLQFFMKNPGKYFTAEKLLALVWENESDASREALTTCVKRLRKKLDLEGEESFIRNIHGAGYGVSGE